VTHLAGIIMCMTWCGKGWAVVTIGVAAGGWPGPVSCGASLWAGCTKSRSCSSQQLASQGVGTWQGQACRAGVGVQWEHGRFTIRLLHNRALPATLISNAIFSLHWLAAAALNWLHVARYCSCGGAGAAGPAIALVRVAVASTHVTS
jgi:hypothetical protein